MRIIAVDDEALVLNSMKKTIEAVMPNAEILSFEHADEAVEFAKNNYIDVAFLDIRMHKMNGLTLAKKLKDIYKKTNIVFATGYSEYALDAFSVHANGYLLKPVCESDIVEALEHLHHDPATATRKKEHAHQGLRVQTFGNFEVFANDKPVVFPRRKSKELFAYLVHRRGAGCSTKEIAAILFEDQPYDIPQRQHVQVIRSAMIKSLHNAGHGDVVIRNFNSISVDVSKLDCDYYRFLQWDVDAINSYAGEYMTNYSWAVFVIGYLDSKLQK